MAMPNPLHELVPALRALVMQSLARDSDARERISAVLDEINEVLADPIETWRNVEAHSEFAFGTVFTKDDVRDYLTEEWDCAVPPDTAPEMRELYDRLRRRGEDAIVDAGWEAVYQFAVEAGLRLGDEPPEDADEGSA
jgi:hypothetical protein